MESWMPNQEASRNITLRHETQVETVLWDHYYQWCQELQI